MTYSAKADQHDPSRVFVKMPGREYGMTKSEAVDLAHSILDACGRNNARCDRCKINTTMAALNDVCTFGDMMDLDEALRELGLDKREYAILAEKEELPKIAQAINALVDKAEDPK